MSKTNNHRKINSRLIASGKKMELDRWNGKNRPTKLWNDVALGMYRCRIRQWRTIHPTSIFVDGKILNNTPVEEVFVCSDSFLHGIVWGRFVCVRAVVRIWYWAWCCWLKPYLFLVTFKHTAIACWAIPLHLHSWRFGAWLEQQLKIIAQGFWNYLSRQKQKQHSHHMNLSNSCHNHHIREIYISKSYFPVRNNPVALMGEDCRHPESLKFKNIFIIFSSVAYLSQASATQFLGFHYSVPAGWQHPETCSPRFTFYCTASLLSNVFTA